MRMASIACSIALKMKQDGRVLDAAGELLCEVCCPEQDELWPPRNACVGAPLRTTVSLENLSGSQSEGLSFRHEVESIKHLLNVH